MKMERINCDFTVLVTCSSRAISGRAGATIDEEIGETTVKEDMMRVAAHFRFMDQFLGFLGSSGESHVTYPVHR
jgi:hypothetical protein